MPHTQIQIFSLDNYIILFLGIQWGLDQIDVCQIYKITGIVVILKFLQLQSSTHQNNNVVLNVMSAWKIVRENYMKRGTHLSYEILSQRREMEIAGQSYQSPIRGVSSNHHTVGTKLAATNIWRTLLTLYTNDRSAVNVF